MTGTALPAASAPAHKTPFPFFWRRRLLAPQDLRSPLHSVEHPRLVITWMVLMMMLPGKQRARDQDCCLFLVLVMQVLLPVPIRAGEYVPSDLPSRECSGLPDEGSLTRTGTERSGASPRLRIESSQVQHSPSRLCRKDECQSGSIEGSRSLLYTKQWCAICHSDRRQFCVGDPTCGEGPDADTSGSGNAS